MTEIFWLEDGKLAGSSYPSTHVLKELYAEGFRVLIPLEERDDIPELETMAITEATSGQTSGISEALVQNFSDHVRVFPHFGASAVDGVFRFAGLRVVGGFVLAGEAVDGKVTQVVVHSTLGGSLTLAASWPDGLPVVEPDTHVVTRSLADGADALVIATVAGETYTIRVSDKAAEIAPPTIEERTDPRRVRCGDWDDFDPPVAYYPEDMPFAQESDGESVYLGMPAKEPASADRAPGVDLDTIRDLATADDWRARQTAARWLGRFAGEATTDPSTGNGADLALELARTLAADPTPIVAYTAGVSLVRQGSVRSLTMALDLARETERPHLRREILKAVSRAARTEAGKEALAECPVSAIGCDDDQPSL